LPDGSMIRLTVAAIIRLPDVVSRNLTRALKSIMKTW
jgi:C-terminal processing peptidase-3. Serine peptidase. MEROPS family S41A